MLHRLHAFLALLLAPTAALAGPDFVREILPALEMYCFDCHGDEAKPKGGVNLERFRDEASVLRDRATWKLAYDQIEGHSMPPPKRKDQPASAERARLIAWLDDVFARPDVALGVRDPGKPALRRLTRLEYSNTVRDLFGLKMDVLMFPERLPVDRRYFQPQAGVLGAEIQVPVREFGLKYAVLLPEGGLPGDNRAEHGFRNRGEAMNLSPSLLEQYLELGRAIAGSHRLIEQSDFFRALIADPAVPPKARTLTEANDGLAFDAATDFAPNLNVPNEATDGDRITTTYQHRFGVRAAAAEGVGGTWTAEARSAVVKGGTPVRVRFGLNKEKALVVTPREELWVAGFSTAHETSGESLFTNNTKGAKTLTLALAITGGAPGEGVAEAGVCVLSRKGESGPVTITAHFTGGGAAKLTRAMPAGEGAGNTFFGFRAPAGQHIAELALDGSQFSGNYVLFDDLGFLTTSVAFAQATPDVRMKIPARETASIARERLGEFLARSFRHPIDDATLGRYFAIYSEVATRRGFSAGMREAVAASLASPEFLYIAESREGRAPVRPLGDYELATRLSYFLWSSAPDAALLALAAQGRLHEPAELERQTLRMLRDPRAKELSESFAVQWLRLDQLFTAKPDPKLFKSFYAGPQGKTTLHGALLVEALLLFETALVENRSIYDFLDADYTWLNPQLARHYGLESSLPAAALAKKPGDDSTLLAAKTNSAWYRVPLHDKRRGGFTTMAGPLTVTALPTRTSPVKRGAWLLETVFNRPPPELKVAFALKDEKTGSAQTSTVRQRFEQHRNEPACYSCHVRLDPPGFALEAFDPIGAWREKDGTAPVDARAEWNGKPFNGPAGFKAALMASPHEFTRGFIEHLLSFALGRKVEYFDAPVVAEIERAAAADGWKLQRVITEIVKSYPFRNVRNDPPNTATR